MIQSGRGILIVTAVEVEKDAVLRGLKNNSGFDVIAAGVGPIAAAAGTAKVLATTEYRLVISAGIGGGFPGRAEVGSLVVADRIIAADLGVETTEGFCSLDELGFGETSIPVDDGLVNRVNGALAAAKLLVMTGPVLTVSTVTGTAESAARLAARVPGAAAEAMEGYGVALAAHNCGIPVLELRAISNAVGPRDRAAWRIKEALDVLAVATSVLPEVLS
ncbi:MAG: futalosine hydrolase [Clostridia bacterium]|nr:futalosine hydrolase [Clostridia bacterium]